MADAACRECRRPAFRIGLCSVHYYRQWRSGRPTVICLHCRRLRRLHCRGLCRPCYDRTSPRQVREVGQRSVRPLRIEEVFEDRRDVVAVRYDCGHLRLRIAVEGLQEDADLQRLIRLLPRAGSTLVRWSLERLRGERG